MILCVSDICLSFNFPPATEPAGFLPSSKPLTLAQTQSAVFFLSKLKHNSLQRRKVRPPGPGFSVDTVSEICFDGEIFKDTGSLAGVHVWAFSVTHICSVCYLKGSGFGLFTEML